MDIFEPAQVTAAFAHPGLIPPPPGPGSAFWLRSRVARFSSGPEHARRRALAEAEIASIDPARAAAHAAALVRSGCALREAIVRSLELVPDDAIGPVLEATAAYFDPSLPAPSLDRLVGMLGPEDAEVIAARIGVLAQACDATAVLIEQGMRPQGRVTRRLATTDVRLGDTVIPAGTTVVLHLGDQIFGAPPRECPGRDLAVAIAEAIIKEQSA